MRANLSLFLIVLIFGLVHSQGRQNGPGDAPQNYPGDRDPKYFKIIGYENDIDGKNYNFRFDTEDPIHRDEEGRWEGTGQTGEWGEELGINRVSGHADYNLRDGTPFHLTYEADDKGYRPHFVIGAPFDNNFRSSFPNSEPSRPSNQGGPSRPQGSQSRPQFGSSRR